MLTQEPQLRQLVERAQDAGELTEDELTAVVAELDLTDEDTEAIRAELTELGVDVVSVREIDASDAGEPAEAAPAWYAPASIDGLDLYLAQIGRTPLLTKHEEQVLAQRIEAGDEARSGAWSRPTCGWSCRSPRSTAATASASWT